MRSAPLILLAAAALLLPATALAASSDPAAPQGRYFEIKGLVYGDQKIEAMGKLSVESGQLAASVGCNIIGGPVSIDGEKLTITGPTQMTEMACPGTNGDAEAALIKVLGLSTFHMTPTSWNADGGQIFVVEMAVTGPPTSSGPPDEPVSSGPIATIVDPGPFESCPPIPVDNGTTSVGGGPVSGGGSGSSGSGSTGTGTASPGTVVVPPDPGTAPDAGATSGSEPAASPQSEPAATANDLPLASGSVDPVPPVPAPDASGIYVLPNPIGQDPNIGKPPVDGPCFGSLGAGQVEADAGVPKAPSAQDLATRAAASSASPVLPAFIALVVLLLVGAGLSRRRVASESPSAP